jgi:hypothetical protein
MLSIFLKFLVYTFGVLMVERQYRITHMIYTMEAPTYHNIQAPTPPPKIYIQTIYKDSPPLPHPVIELGIKRSSQSSTSDARRPLFSQHYVSLGSQANATREGSLEELEKHPEYRPQNEKDASEGRHAAEKYIDKHRKKSLRREVTAVIIYGPPPRLNMNWPLILCVLVFGIFLVLVCFGVLRFKLNQKIFEHDKSEAKKRLERSRSALRLDWILRHSDLQYAYESETQRLKSKVIRLREKVTDQKSRIRALTTKKVENRFRYAFLNNKLKGLTDRVADLDCTLRYLKSLHDLTTAFVEPEAAFIRRYEKDAAEAEEKFWDKIRERPGKARTSPTQWWDEQRRDVELAIRFIEKKKAGRNWRIDPAVEERLRNKGLLEPGAFHRPAPSKKVLRRRAFIMREDRWRNLKSSM